MYFFLSLGQGERASETEKIPRRLASLACVLRPLFYIYYLSSEFSHFRVRVSCFSHLQKFVAIITRSCLFCMLVWRVRGISKVARMEGERGTAREKHQRHVGSTPAGIFFGLHFFYSHSHSFPHLPSRQRFFERNHKNWRFLPEKYRFLLRLPTEQSERDASDAMLLARRLITPVVTMPSIITDRDRAKKKPPRETRVTLLAKK